MSWITIDDEVGAILHLLEADIASGPVNLTAAAPATNSSFTDALGRTLGRPTVFPLPAFAVRTLFGQMGDEALLGSQYVLPRRLEAAGYRFAHPDLELALRHILGKT
jgi:NAD dependent epimerase/dehydratase family enzyme